MGAGTRWHSIQPENTEQGAFKRYEIKGAGLRMLSGCREVYRLRFVLGNGTAVDYPGIIYDGLTIPIEFVALDFQFGNVTDTPAAPELVLQTTMRRNLALVSSEQTPEPYWVRRVGIATTTLEAAGVAGDTAAILDTSTDAVAQLTGDYGSRFQQTNRMLRRDAFLRGWVASNRAFTVYLLGWNDQDNPLSAGGFQEPVVFARSNAHAIAVPADVDASPNSHVWSPDWPFASAAPSQGSHAPFFIPAGGLQIVVENTDAAGQAVIRTDLVITSR